MRVSGERVDEQGALVEVSAELEDYAGAYRELAGLRFASVERRQAESVLMTGRTVTVSGRRSAARARV